MLTFVIRRLLGLIAVMFVLSVLVFLLFFETPGVDPARLMAGRNPNPETIAAIKHEFGLDRPLPVRYALMMKRMFITRDLISYGSHTKVIPEIITAAPVTFSLVLPVFWLGEIVNLFTQSRWHNFFLFSWVPPLGYTPLTDDPLKWFEGLVFPWLTLSVLYVGFYARVLRANLIETENEDYIRTARSKGISERRVLIKHNLRTSMIAFVSLFGLDFGILVAGGALLTEVVFGLPGVGLLTYNSLTSLDLPVIMTTVIYGAFFITLASALVDLLYAWLDPRVRPT
jgi:peptide/nickel transport system permease protein